MERKWNRRVEPKMLSSYERKRSAWLNILHQNDMERLDYEPVDVSKLFRSDGMIHLYR